MHEGPGGTPRRALLRAAVALPVLVACSAPTTGTPVPVATTTPAPATTTPRPTPTPARRPVGEVERASTGRQEVALTFHGAGDLGLAKQVLGALQAGGAGVTVLAVGTWLEQYPDAPKVVADLGHELGNHTYAHLDIDSLGATAARLEIERCRDLIARATGAPGAFFRPSRTQHATPAVVQLAAAAGYPTVLSYDIDSQDFTDPGAAAIRQNVAPATAGSVVSMHLGHPGTLQAIPGLLADLRARGLTPVTATRLFA